MVPSNIIRLIDRKLDIQHALGTRRCRLLVMDVGADDFEMMPSEDDLMDFSATKVQVTGLFFSEQQCRIEPIDGEHGQFYSCYSWFIMFIPLSPH